MSLKELLRRAYESYFEIKGPGWLDSEVVAVDATMPPDTTKEQFREMLGNLIVDRFKLKYHVETKEIAGYSLVVAKGGLKIKESVETPAADDVSAAAPRPRVMGPDGFPVPPPGPTIMLSSQAGERARIVFQQQTIDKLVQNLGTMLKTRVTDETGLTAKYDFKLGFAGHLGPSGAEPAALAAEAPAGPDIFSALQSQIGLKLEPKKVSVEIFVVDHMEKSPAEN